MEEIYEEKNNEVKKSKKGLVFTIFLILVIIGLVGYICYDKGIIKLSSQEGVESSEKVSNDKSAIDLDISDANIIGLYNSTTLIDDINGQLNSVNGKDIKKVSVDDMIDAKKILLALKNVDLLPSTAFLTADGITMAYSESAIKTSYEKIFGPNTYKRVDEFTLYGVKFTYNDKHAAYVSNASGVGSGTSAWGYMEAIIGAKRYSDRIEITTAVILSDHNTNAYYKNSDLKDKVSDFAGVCDSEEYNDDRRTDCYHEFIRKNKSKLMQYTYTYKLNKDGFYYYTGAERTKE